VFGDAPPAFAEVRLRHPSGREWPGLEQTLVAHWDQIQRYRYVGLPDDDLLCVPEDSLRMSRSARSCQPSWRSRR